MQRAGAPTHVAGPLAQGAGPLSQGVGPLSQTTVPQLEGAEPEPEAELDGEAPHLDPQDDPRPVQPKDPGLKSCVCLI